MKRYEGIAAEEPGHCIQTVNPGARISFDPNSRTVAESCNAAPSRPSLPLIRRRPF
jgi:hypothetical protein